MTYFWTSIITMVIFLNVHIAVGDVDAGCPVRCSCSKMDSFENSLEVKCSGLVSSDIPAMLNSFTVNTLDLSYNKISILKNVSFSSYSSILNLVLSYSNVEEIEINAFVGLQRIRNIDLSHNELKSLNPKIFSSNLVLETVSLVGNSLGYLSSDSPILISSSILFLYLSSCSLTTIHPLTFSELPSLYDLDLSSNDIHNISVSIFGKLPNLTKLKLNSCSLVEVMERAEPRREQQPAHKPVTCSEGQQERILWAEGTKHSSESKSTEPSLTREIEFTTDVTVDSSPASVGVPLSPKTSPHTSGGLTHELKFTTNMTEDLPTVSVDDSLSLETSPRTPGVVQTVVTIEAVDGAAVECKTVFCDIVSTSKFSIHLAVLFLCLLCAFLGLLCGAAIFKPRVAFSCCPMEMFMSRSRRNAEQGRREDPPENVPLRNR